MSTILGVIVGVKSKGRYLLIKNGGVWKFPTGKLNLDLNGSMDDTARRELKEVTDLTAKQMEYVGGFQRIEGDRCFFGHGYIVKKFSGDIRLSEQKYKWVDEKEIMRMGFEGKIDVDTMIFLTLCKD